jgi:hypothetical protein
VKAARYATSVRTVHVIRCAAFLYSLAAWFLETVYFSIVFWPRALVSSEAIVIASEKDAIDIEDLDVVRTPGCLKIVPRVGDLDD